MCQQGGENNMWSRKRDVQEALENCTIRNYTISDFHKTSG